MSSSMSNGPTSGIFANLVDLQASKPNVNTRVELVSGERFSIDAADGGSGLPVNGLFANPLFTAENIRYSLIDNPLCHLFKTNKLVETSAPTGTDSDVTWLRSTIATSVDRYGIVKSAAINEPREEKEGFLIESASTNLVIQNRDYGNAAFVKTNITAAKDATGRDDVNNAASSLAATSANGTCFQAFVITSQENTYSVDVKRKTGSGVIEVSDDGGATYTNITSLINSESYTRVDITSTQANPSIGFRIVTSGDAIEVDYTQLENLPFPTSRIETAASAETRTGDQPSINYYNNFIFDSPFTFFTIFSRDSDFNSDMALFSNADGNRPLLQIRTDGRLRYFDNATSFNSPSNSVTVGVSEIAMVYNGENLLMYVNGDIVLDTPYTPVVTALLGDIYLGVLNNNIEQINGHLKGTKLIPLALNQDEITYLSGQ